MIDGRGSASAAEKEMDLVRDVSVNVDERKGNHAAVLALEELQRAVFDECSSAALAVGESDRISAAMTHVETHVKRLQLEAQAHRNSAKELEAKYKEVAQFELDRSQEHVS